VLTQILVGREYMDDDLSPDLVPIYTHSKPCSPSIILTSPEKSVG
jgi:hypothetical protein